MIIPLEPMNAVELKFWSKVRFGDCGPLGTCWEWTGAIHKPSARDAGGGAHLRYGRFWYLGKNQRAHRVSFALAMGADLADVPLVGHECDYPLCVRPSHLRCITHSENMQAQWDRNRRQNDEKNLDELGDFFERMAAE